MPALRCAPRLRNFPARQMQSSTPLRPLRLLACPQFVILSGPDTVWAGAGGESVFGVASYLFYSIGLFLQRLAGRVYGVVRGQHMGPEILFSQTGRMMYRLPPEKKLRRELLLVIPITIRDLRRCWQLLQIRRLPLESCQLISGCELGGAPLHPAADGPANRDQLLHLRSHQPDR